MREREEGERESERERERERERESEREEGERERESFCGLCFPNVFVFLACGEPGATLFCVEIVKRRIKNFLYSFFCFLSNPFCAVLLAVCAFFFFLKQGQYRND